MSGAGGRPYARIGLAVAMFALLATGCGTHGDGDAGASRSGAGGSVLDDGETSFVVVGGSASYAWPTMLQELLDEHTGGERRHHVLNAAVGGSPVSRWIADPESDDHDDTFGAMLRDFFGSDARIRGDAPEPTVALCQPSLQRIDADAVSKLAVRLHERGIERVYVATPIYNEPVDPEAGDERIDLSTLLDLDDDFVFAGPDVWTPTRDAHPDALAEDGIHPAQLGMKIMAEQWYRTLAGGDARQEVVNLLYAADHDIEIMMTDHINRRRP